MTINEDLLPLDTKQHHLLVVDDDRINRELLSHLFERDYHVSMASSGQDAINMIKDDPSIDLIMLDIMMPNMSGLDVLGIIRDNPPTKDLPVILISAMANSRDVVNGLRLGANDYITKPVDVSVVVARVKTQLMIKRLLDERKETIIELEKAETLRSQLFRIASHDLKTPLSNIRMAEHLLRKMVPAEKLVTQTLDTIKFTVDSMGNIISNFLDMVELQTGRMDLKLKPIELLEVIHNVVTQYEISANKKDITVEIGETAGWVMADVARLIQVVSNLVSNAIKYSPQHTTIKIYTEVKDNCGYIYVADQGPGIPEKERGQLFTEFGKLSTRPTGGESSTGLGLWIVKHLSNAQDGDVGVLFPETGGSTFWVSLPEYTPPAPEKTEDTSDTPKTTKPSANDAVTATADDLDERTVPIQPQVSPENDPPKNDPPKKD